MSTLYRAQILLEPEQHQMLAKIAQNDGRSISEIVREIVGQYLATQEQEIRLQQELHTIEALTQMRQEIQEQHGVYQGDFLSEIRTEWEQDIERVWGNER
jgi:hypothetical protein